MRLLTRLAIPLLCLPSWGMVLFNTSYTFGTSETGQPGRLTRSGVPSKWSAAKAFPGVFGAASSYRVKTFSITPDTAQYVQVNFDDPQAVFFAAAYLDAFNPAAGSSSGVFLGDSGGSGNPLGNPGYFQIFVPYGHTLTLAVNEVTPGSGAGQSFSLQVEGYGDSQYSPPYPIGPDLVVTSSHVGSFIAGYGGYDYFLLVVNVGTAPANSAIKLTDILPPGMTATAISGLGWTCDLAAVSCVTNALLPPGARTSGVTLTVSTSAILPSLVINTATVSGGGDQVTFNNTAGDVTSISPTKAPLRPHLPPVRLE